jgi:hypothetical protein
MKKDDSHTFPIVTDEIKNSVKEAIAIYSIKCRPTYLDIIVDGDFPMEHEKLFLALCLKEYRAKNVHWFLQLAKKLRYKKPYSPPAGSTSSFNDSTSFLIVQWAGFEYVKQLLKIEDDSLDEIQKMVENKIPEGIIPLCFYSVEAITQLYNEVFQFTPQRSYDAIKKLIQRLGLVKGDTLVKSVEYSNQGYFYQHPVKLNAT